MIGPLVTRESTLWRTQTICSASSCPMEAVKGKQIHNSNLQIARFRFSSFHANFLPSHHTDECRFVRFVFSFSTIQSQHRAHAQQEKSSRCESFFSFDGIRAPEVCKAEVRGSRGRRKINRSVRYSSCLFPLHSLALKPKGEEHSSTTPFAMKRESGKAGTDDFVRKGVKGRVR
jgi:hypothetical protein